MNGIQEFLRSEYAPVANLPIGTVKENIREISLTQGLTALVDKEDYDWLSQYKWYAHKNRYTYYAARHTLLNGVYRSDTPIMRMHREIMGLGIGDKQQIDHINQNGLHNYKSNLRIATPSVNSLNRKMRNDNKSGYRGVCFVKRTRKWGAVITINKIHYHCGYFNDPISAAIAYDNAAIKYYGTDALLNFPKETL